MSSVLAFDFGASSCRAIRGHYDGHRITYEEVYRFENKLITVGSRLCWNYPFLLEQVKRIIDDTKNIQSIAFDTWGVDYGLLDDCDKLLGLPISYRDTRTSHILDSVLNTITPSELYSKTGNQIMPINTLFQLLTEQPGHAKTLLFMPDLFVWSLCGCISADKTIASTSQMFDPQKCVWNHDIVQKFKIDAALLPNIVDIPLHCGIYKGAKITKIAGHDTQCAIAAMPCLDNENAAFLSCGTWSILGCELDEPILTEQSMGDALSNECGANGKINYLKNICGLWLLQELRRDFQKSGLDCTYHDMELLASQAPAFSCFVDPDDSSFAVPGNIVHKINLYCKKSGQIIPQTRRMQVRCVYESLVMKYRYAIEQIKRNVGKQFDVIYLLGGGTKDPLLCQMVADCLGISVIAGPIEATALGNMILQFIALGEINSICQGRELIRHNESLVQYHPQHHELYNNAYHRFVHLLSHK